MKKKEEIVGIFTVWSVELIDKAENVFRRKLDKNPTHPFEAVGPGIYHLEVKPVRLWFFTGCLVTAIIATISQYWSKPADFELLFYVAASVGAGIAVLYYRKVRMYIIDTNKNLYEFYLGEMLIYRGHVHNIYIRLKGQKTANGEMRYQVVLNGFMIEEVVITSSSQRNNKLAKLARRLAHRLNLNYFDTPDKSRYHVIRHQCPYRLMYDEKYEP